jgi:hypothetical protein
MRPLAALMLSLFVGSPACKWPQHVCEIRGSVTADDGTVNQPCSLDLYIGDRTDRLVHTPVVTGKDFSLPIGFPVIDPRSSWHGVIRCEGYEDTQTPQFDLGAGWGSCPRVELGKITVKRLPREGALLTPRFEPPNKALQLTKPAQAMVLCS